MNDDKVFSLLIYLAGGVIAFVIIVGGIVCLADDNYTFNAYLQDLANVWPYLVGAIAAVLIRSIVITRNGKKNGNHKERDGSA